MRDPTQRFSSRVENYIKYRPSYPPTIIDTLCSECQLTPASIVADVGSGTGILTQLFLNNGNRVFAVEPNRDMREAAERLIGSSPGFSSINGTAEATTLGDRSVDLIAAGQAFHWFDREKTRVEFQRILKPAGWVALVWNERATATTPFLEAYEKLLLEFATDYEQVNHTQIDAAVIQEFFGANKVHLKTLPNEQRFDYAGLRGRLMSSSYAPEEGHANHEPMLAALKKIFEKYQTGNQVIFEYDTKLYYGQMKTS